MGKSSSYPAKYNCKIHTTFGLEIYVHVHVTYRYAAQEHDLVHPVSVQPVAVGSHRKHVRGERLKVRGLAARDLGGPCWPRGAMRRERGARLYPIGPHRVFLERDEQQLVSDAVAVALDGSEVVL